MADKIVRIVADTTKYQKGINDAKRSLSGFNSAGSVGTKALQGMMGAFKIMIPALSLATTGLAALKKGIGATQTTADAFKITLHSLKGVTDNFFTSINQGNLNVFVRNLKEAASAAREAAQWVDQFGNTQMSYNYATASIREQIQEQRTVIARESGTSPAERQAAAQELQRLLEEWRQAGNVYAETALKKISSEISSKSMGLIGTDQISAETIDKVFRIDAQADYAEQRKELASEYSEYLYRLKEIEDRFMTRINALNPKTSMAMAGGLPVLQDVRTTEAQNKLRAEMDAAKKALAAQYETPIVFNALLEVDTDEELQKAMSTMQEIYNSGRLIDKTAKTINSDIKQMNDDLAKTQTLVRSSMSALSAPSVGGLKGFAAKEEPKKQAVTYAMSYVPEAISGGTDYSGVMSSLNGLTGQLNTKQLADYNEQLLKIGQRREMIDSLAGSFAALGMAIQGTGSDALAAAGAIVQMVAQIVPAMTTLFASSSAAGTAEAVAETPTLAGKIAAIATVTASIIGMVSTFKNIQFAEGGIVPGSDFTDGITARVSSGEMVLNAHDQRNLYESIKSGSIGGGGGRSYITGEQLVTVINNYGRRTGRGEILR